MNLTRKNHRTSTPGAVDARGMLGTHDVLFLIFDTLRFDVAVEEWAAGRTPCLASILPERGWERRHTPASFTYAAHQAFLAGFLPTPTEPGPHPRLFALSFGGSETITDRTLVFDAPSLPAGFRQAGYHTLCIGGVGFFNPDSPLGCVLPGFFDESYWSSATGVTAPDSTANQVQVAVERLDALEGRRVFGLINLSALHQPNCFYLDGATEDSRETHAAALRYVDSQLPPLFGALARRGPSLVVLCSDHGTMYGEEGYFGHRLAHPLVWTVPYAELELPEVP